MSMKTPVLRQISWLSVLPQLAAMVLSVGICNVFLSSDGNFASITGLLIYLGYSYGSRWILLKSHNYGMMLTNQERYAEAIDKFEASYRFFSKYAWVDRYRSLTMMSSAKHSYREMALINIATCNVQIGNIEQAKLHYARTLQEFPNNSMAQDALDAIELHIVRQDEEH